MATRGLGIVSHERGCNRRPRFLDQEHTTLASTWEMKRSRWPLRSRNDRSCESVSFVLVLECVCVRNRSVWEGFMCSVTRFTHTHTHTHTWAQQANSGMVSGGAEFPNVSAASYDTRGLIRDRYICACSLPLRPLLFPSPLSPCCVVHSFLWIRYTEQKCVC
jgi:hypothetical protein